MRVEQQLFIEYKMNYRLLRNVTRLLFSTRLKEEKSENDEIVITVIARLYIYI